MTYRTNSREERKMMLDKLFELFIELKLECCDFERVCSDEELPQVLIDAAIEAGLLKSQWSQKNRTIT